MENIERMEFFEIENKIFLYFLFLLLSGCLLRTKRRTETTLKENRLYHRLLYSMPSDDCYASQSNSMVVGCAYQRNNALRDECSLIFLLPENWVGVNGSAFSEEFPKHRCISTCAYSVLRVYWLRLRFPSAKQRKTHCSK